jgi:hypothetical protein
MIYVTEANYIKDYQIEICFNDKKVGLVDLKNTIETDNRKIFQELKNIEKFKFFSVDMDTIVWKNGLDLAPEFLYDLAFNKKPN